MKKKPIEKFVFILTTMALIISVKLFWNMAIYVDEYGTSPSVVLGGNFWLLMSWLRLFILLVLSVISFIKLFDPKK